MTQNALHEVVTSESDADSEEQRMHIMKIEATFVHVNPGGPGKYMQRWNRSTVIGRSREMLQLQEYLCNPLITGTRDG